MGNFLRLNHMETVQEQMSSYHCGPSFGKAWGQRASLYFLQEEVRLALPGQKDQVRDKSRVTLQDVLNLNLVHYA